MTNSEFRNLNSEFSWFFNPPEFIIFILILFRLNDVIMYLKITWKFGFWNLWKHLGRSYQMSWIFLVIKHLCEMQKFISILIQGHILFIALSYNKFCRLGEYDNDIDVMSNFFDEKKPHFHLKVKLNVCCYVFLF